MTNLQLVCVDVVHATSHMQSGEDGSVTGQRLQCVSCFVLGAMYSPSLCDLLSTKTSVSDTGAVRTGQCHQQCHSDSHTVRESIAKLGGLLSSISNGAIGKLLFSFSLLCDLGVVRSGQCYQQCHSGSHTMHEPAAQLGGLFIFSGLTAVLRLAQIGLRQCHHCFKCRAGYQV